MYFAFNIAVHNRTSEEIRAVITEVMKNEGFNIATLGIRLQTSIDNLLPEIDDKLMLRKFIITPNNNKWSIVYPSTGWFSEVEDLVAKLSNKLDCVAMVLLVDDSYGWGYVLYQQGNVTDRFHTQPMLSPTLREKSAYGLIPGDKITDITAQLEEQSIDNSTLATLNLPTSEQIVGIKRHLLDQEAIGLLTPEQKSQLEGKLDQILANLSLPTSVQKAELVEHFLTDPSILDKPFSLTVEREAQSDKYSGTPSTIANVFGVLEDLVIHYLSASESNFETGLHDKMTGFFELLDLEDVDRTYQDLVEDFKDSEDHLIFVREMTAVELQWREKWKEKLPYVAPPLWLNET